MFHYSSQFFIQQTLSLHAASPVDTAV